MALKKAGEQGDTHHPRQLSHLNPDPPPQQEAKAREPELGCPSALLLTWGLLSLTASGGQLSPRDTSVPVIPEGVGWWFLHTHQGLRVEDAVVHMHLVAVVTPAFLLL